MIITQRSRCERDLIYTLVLPYIKNKTCIPTTSSAYTARHHLNCGLANFPQMSFLSRGRELFCRAILSHKRQKLTCECISSNKFLWVFEDVQNIVFKVVNNCSIEKIVSSGAQQGHADVTQVIYSVPSVQLMYVRVYRWQIIAQHHQLSTPASPIHH